MSSKSLVQYRNRRDPCLRRETDDLIDQCASQSCSNFHEARRRFANPNTCVCSWSDLHEVDSSTSNLSVRTWITFVDIRPKDSVSATACLYLQSKPTGTYCLVFVISPTSTYCSTSPIMLGSLYSISVTLGVAAHLLYFHRYETHNYAHRILAGIVVTAASIAVLMSRTKDLSLLVSTAIATAYVSCFAAGALASTIVYRLFFNPLNRFPGPFATRLSDFYIAFTVGGKLNQYHKLYELHQRYGRIVRRGATELSIADPDFVEPSYNSHTRVTKGPWYDMENIPALLSERVQTQHDRRRKHWVPAFSDKALREYEPRIQIFNDKFISQLTTLDGKPMDVSEWFKLYAFDVIGSLAFGKNYQMLDSGEKHHALGLLTEGMSPLGLTIPVW